MRIFTSFNSECRPMGFMMLALAAAVAGGCSTGSGEMYGTGQMTTSSIAPPRPAEDLVQDPARPYSEGYGLGRRQQLPVAAPRQGQYQWNGNPSRLNEGTAPALPPAAARMAADGRKHIVVRPGDTLYSISRQQGVSMQDLMAANKLASPNLSAGQTLLLPSTIR